jgi:hypothetical protein
MRNHTTPKIWELSGPQGKLVTIVPTAAAQVATWQMTNMPTGKDGRLWYYCTAIVIAVTITMTQAGAGSIIPDLVLGNVIQSMQVTSPVLGAVFAHQNTRGIVAKTFHNYVCTGFGALTETASIPIAAATYVRTIYFRLPFANEFLRKPHETSPWGGFFEGGTVEARVDVSTILAAFSTAAVVTSVALRTWCEFIPSPERVIHTPFHIREHQNLPGNTGRHTITDMGASDGLQGINLSAGVGMAGFYYICNPILPGVSNTGLGGAGTAANFLSYDIAWRDQTRIDSPDAPFHAALVHMGVHGKNVTNLDDGSGFPYTNAATAGSTVAGTQANDANAMYFPFVHMGRDLETSKLQSVAGARDINVTYTATPAGAPRFLGVYFPQFDEAYMRTVLIPRIAPDAASAAILTAKTLNKVNGVRGVGKLAYTRTKITSPKQKSA